MRHLHFDLQRFADDDSGENGGANGGKAGKVTFSEEQQAELDRIIRDRVGRAEKNATKSALEARAKELGFDSVDAMETAVKAHKDAKDKEKSDLDKEREARTAAEQKAKDAETKAAKRLIDAEAKVQAAALGIKPERVAYALKLADLSEVKIGSDGEPEAASIKAAIEAVLKDMPELKGTSQALGGGSNPGGGGGTGEPTAADLEAMTPEQYAAYYKKRQGGK